MTDAGPDPRHALARYRGGARRYDRRTRLLERYRRRAIQRLALEAGQTVIDVACGTGLNFGPIEAEIGPAGRLLGVDLSPEMVAVAKQRVERAGWQNVSLIEAAVEDADLSQPVDAALFSFTHDVLQSERAVDHVVAAVSPGGRVVAVGAKWTSGWRAPVNVAMRVAVRPFVTALWGLDCPWRHLEPHLRDLRIEELALGGLYVASGVRRGVYPGPPPPG